MLATGKLPVSFPRATGTTPSFYNYLKGGRPVDPGMVLDDGTLMFGHQVRALFHYTLSQTLIQKQYVLNTPIPLWSFGHGLSYTNFT